MIGLCVPPGRMTNIPFPFMSIVYEIPISTPLYSQLYILHTRIAPLLLIDQRINTESTCILFINHHIPLLNPHQISTSIWKNPVHHPLFHLYFSQLTIVPYTNSSTPTSLSKRSTAHSLVPSPTPSHNKHGRVRPNHNHHLRPARRLRSNRHGLRHGPHLGLAL